MGRRRRVDEKALTAKLAKPPKLLVSSKKRIEKIEEDKATRAALAAEVAQLDETIEQLREEVLRGKAFAAGAIVRAQKLRAELLRLKTPDVKPPPQGDGTVDVPIWRGRVEAPLVSQPAPPTSDDAELDEALAESMRGS